MIITDDTKDIEYFYIDEYKIYKINNVLKYNENYNGNSGTQSQEINFTKKISDFSIKEDIENYYFCIDLFYHEAFAHWIFESAIYLNVFHKLKKIYPTLKLKLKIFKKFKKLFCDKFNIQKNDIVYKFDDLKEYTCFFPSPISSLNDLNALSETYIKQLNYFLAHFNYKKDKTLDTILLPRQKLENFWGNERVRNSEELEKYFSTVNKSYVLHTDMIDNIDDQINYVKSSKHVILTDGSPFLVNGIFCHDSKILIIFSEYESQMRFPKMKYVYNYISSNNNIIIRIQGIDLKKIVENIA